MLFNIKLKNVTNKIITNENIRKRNKKIDLEKKIGDISQLGGIK